ncbi:MAG: DUF3786 domain-containing protein [Pseudomonadota bacterium]
MELAAPVFEDIYRDYLAQLEQAWPGLTLTDLGVERRGEAVAARLFGQDYLVTPAGISDQAGRKPSHARCVVLAKYLLARPGPVLPRGQWTSYRGFKDAAPYAGSFAMYAEGRIAKAFAGRRAELAAACAALGAAAPPEEFNYDLSLHFYALPRVPMLMLFNDQDEDFPASCSLLFDESAPSFLDMECLAILGLVMAEVLDQPLSGGDAAQAPSMIS